MNGPLKNNLQQLHEMANRLFNMLLRAGNVRNALGELRDAASSLDLALANGRLSPEAFCRVANAINQLRVFLCNVGTGLDQQGEQGFHSEMNQLTLAHLFQWKEYLNGLAEALNSGTCDGWAEHNLPPPGQPEIPHR